MEITVDTSLRELFETEEFRPYQQFMIACSPEHTESIKKYTPASMQRDYPNREARSMVLGLKRFQELRQSGHCIAPELYSKAEIEAEPRLAGTRLFFFPGKPGEKFVLLCGGGGFHHVCNMTEAFPVAARLNELGYNVFCLSYRIEPDATRADWDRVKRTALEDVSKAVEVILKNAESFRVSARDYAIGGFSAGCMLTGMWCIGKYGWQKYKLPAPGMAFMIYGYVDDLNEVDETFPASFIAANEDDPLFDPRPTFLKDWSARLSACGTANKLMLGKKGGHGFGLGLGTDCEGWVDEAVSFWEVHKGQR